MNKFLKMLPILAVMNLFICAFEMIFLGGLLRDNSTVIFIVVPGIISAILWLIGFFGFNSHKIEQKLLKFANKKGLDTKKLLSEEKNLKDSLIYEKGKVYSASIYMVSIFTAFGLLGSYFIPEIALKNNTVLAVGIIDALITVAFVCLFYYFEYRSYKTVYPKITFWEYFTARVFLNSLDS